MCESGLGDFLISDVQPLLLFKQCSMWLHEGLRDPEQPAIVPQTPGSLPTYPPCVDIPGFVLYQLWAVSCFFVAQTKMILISPNNHNTTPGKPQPDGHLLAQRQITPEPLELLPGFTT